MKKTIAILILLVFILVGKTFAQNVVTFSIMPPVLNDTTSFDLYITSTFPSGPCDTHFQNYSVMGSIVEAQAEHCIGSTGSSCTTTDTFHIEPLSAGTYIFNLDLSYTLNVINCANLPVGTYYSATFEINPVISGIVSVKNDIKYFSEEKQLHLLNLSLSSNSSLTVFDYLGKKVLDKRIYNDEAIDLSTLTNGVYFCCLTINQKQYFIKVAI